MFAVCVANPDRIITVDADRAAADVLAKETGTREETIKGVVSLVKLIYSNVPKLNAQYFQFNGVV